MTDEATKTPEYLTTAAVLPRWQRPIASLFVRDYRLLWLGQLSTSMGQWMDQVARGWLIYSITGSPLLLGAVTATRAVPLLFFGVLAGVVADRFGRKAQLIIAQTGNAAINLLLAVLVMTNHVEIWHIFATGFIAGTLQAFQQPARQALISEIVGTDRIMNAVALNSAVLNLSRSIGPAVAGYLIHWVGTDGSYYAQSLVYIVATVWTIQMRVPPMSAERLRRNREESMFQGLMEGFSYIRRNETIWLVLVLALVPLLLGQPYSNLLPVFAKDVLGMGSEGLGFLYTAAGLGALIGAMYIASVGNLHHKGMLLLGGAGLFGVSLILLAFSTSLVTTLACLAIAGFANTSYNALANTVLQTATPDELRGRVLSIYFLNRGLVPLGTLMAGALAASYGAPIAVGLMGAACALLAVALSFRAPALRRIE